MHAHDLPHARPDHNLIDAADGTRLFVRDWGEGAPIVFVAGWALNADAWAYQMAPLAQLGCRCLAYDRRGHGRSGDAGRGYDFDTLADDLAAVLDARDLRDVLLVGHSMGAGEVIRYLTRHGRERVAGIALVAPATPFMLKTVDHPQGIDAAVFEASRTAMAHGFFDWIEANAAPYFTPETSRAAIDWTRDMMLNTSLQAVLALSYQQQITDFRPELADVDALRVPTLVVQGECDASAPLELTGRATAARIGGARLVVYPDAPHGLYFTHAARLNQDLLDFRASLTPTA